MLDYMRQNQQQQGGALSGVGGNGAINAPWLSAPTTSSWRAQPRPMRNRRPLQQPLGPSTAPEIGQMPTWQDNINNAREIQTKLNNEFPASARQPLQPNQPGGFFNGWNRPETPPLPSEDKRVGVAPSQEDLSITALQPAIPNLSVLNTRAPNVDKPGGIGTTGYTATMPNLSVTAPPPAMPNLSILNTQRAAADQAMRDKLASPGRPEPTAPAPWMPVTGYPGGQPPKLEAKQKPNLLSILGPDTGPAPMKMGLSSPSLSILRG